MPKCFVCSKNVVPLHRQNKKMTTSCDFGLWCNGNTTDSGPVFLGSSPSSPTEKGVLSNRDTFFVSSFYFLFQIEIFFLTFL